MLIEVNNQKEADKFLVQTRIVLIDIRVTHHRNLNSSQGVISEPDLTNETDADLLEGIKDHGVTAVKRITMRIETRK